MPLDKLRDCIYLKVIASYNMEGRKYFGGKIPLSVAPLRGLKASLSREQYLLWQKLRKERSEEILSTIVNPYYIPHLEYIYGYEFIFLGKETKIKFLDAITDRIVWKALIYLDNPEFKTVDEVKNELIFYDPEAIRAAIAPLPEPSDEEILQLWKRMKLIKKEGFFLVEPDYLIIGNAIPPENYRVHLINQKLSDHSHHHRNVIVEPRLATYIIKHNPIYTPPGLTSRIPILLSCWYMKIFNALALLSTEEQKNIYRQMGILTINHLLSSELGVLFNDFHCLLQVMTYQQLETLIPIFDGYDNNVPDEAKAKLGECFERYRKGLMVRGVTKTMTLLHNIYYEMANRRYQPGGQGYREAETEFQDLVDLQLYEGVNQ